MPSDEGSRRNGNSDQKSWTKWKQELFEAMEDLDQACAHARQVIYRLRPLVRPKTERNEDEPEREREPREPRQPARFRSRRRERDER